jgi:hypothetical protein
VFDAIMVKSNCRNRQLELATARSERMREIVRTNDPVLLSFLDALLREAGVPFHVADTNMSIVEGSIGAFPRRLCVSEDDWLRARRLIYDAGLAGELVDAADR